MWSQDVMTEPPATHVIVPEPGTVTREADGTPASMFSPLDWPLLAECQTCGGQVREERSFVSDGWIHVPEVLRGLRAVCPCGRAPAEHDYYGRCPLVPGPRSEAAMFSTGLLRAFLRGQGARRITEHGVMRKRHAENPDPIHR
jgi:hypothetical protein